MINSQELLCVVNEYDVPITPLPRHVVFKKKLWRRTVHVWIVNDNKQILCQRRSVLKDSSPGMWEPAVAGHISPDDNYFSGAVREVQEETGLPISLGDLNLFKIYKDHKFREYRGIFYCKWNGGLHEVKSEIEEVDKVKFVNISTLKKYLLYQKSPLWCYSGYEKELLLFLNKED